MIENLWLFKYENMAHPKSSEVKIMNKDYNELSYLLDLKKESR